MPRTPKIISAGIAGTLLATVLGVAGASAEDVDVSFTVEANAGGLSVASAATSAAVANGASNPVFDAANAATFSDTLPDLTVTDQRGTLLAGWTVSASGSDFVNGSDSNHTVAASNARVYNNVADATALTTALGGALAGMTVTGGEFNVGLNNLGTQYDLLTGTTPLGNGSVVVTPTIDVTVPANTPAGTYTGTVTFTAS